METCVAAGGTITGEHGVGLDKSAYLPLVLSEDDMRRLLKVRAAFVADGLCNPGKIIPVLKGCGEARVVAEAKNASRSNGEAPRPKDEAREPAREVLKTEVQTATLSSSKAAATIATSTLTDAKGDVLFVEPDSTEEVCEVLRDAEREGRKVFPVGARVQHDLEEDALPVNAVVLKTTRTARLVEHAPADLVATAEAGMTLADFNREVGRALQWLPLDPPGGASATLGGLVATGAAGA